jgi:ABC-type enterochelin transport system ATPase subunit
VIVLTEYLIEVDLWKHLNMLKYFRQTVKEYITAYIIVVRDVLGVVMVVK